MRKASGEIAEGVTEELDTAPAAKPDVGASNASKDRNGDSLPFLELAAQV